MNHFHQGDTNHVPKFLAKFADGAGTTLLRPGAGDYEEKFSMHWLAVAWSMFLFNILAMLVVIVHMSTGNLQYQWLPHLAGTAIINCCVGFMAVVYRFVLFPAPSYVQYVRDPRYAHTEVPYGSPVPGYGETGPSPFTGTPTPYPQPYTGRAESLPRGNDYTGQPNAGQAGAPGPGLASNGAGLRVAAGGGPTQ